MVLGLVTTLITSTACDSVCEQANEHREDCDASANARDCSFETPYVECEAACDLEASCDYFQGNSPPESRTHAQCSSRCTCESAQRRVVECGLDLSFQCDAVCNCAYLSTCAALEEYAACRADCPPWP
ncbi:MAG: hypothetical protein HOW73_48510 [Polyangiaceae bacterium]|nr:hypothetical protein [Polyangiaceae bacterium]